MSRLGDPLLAIAGDQYGNGNVQFYGMDSVASVQSKDPTKFMDLSIDPDAFKTHHQVLVGRREGLREVGR